MIKHFTYGFPPAFANGAQSEQFPPSDLLFFIMEANLLSFQMWHPRCTSYRHNLSAPKLRSWRLYSSKVEDCGKYVHDCAERVGDRAAVQCLTGIMKRWVSNDAWAAYPTLSYPSLETP